MPQIIAIINTSLNFCGLILGGVDSWSVVSGHTQTFGTYIGTCTYYMQPLQVHWYVHVPEQTYLIHKFIKFRGCLEAASVRTNVPGSSKHTWTRFHHPQILVSPFCWMFYASNCMPLKNCHAKISQWNFCPSILTIFLLVSYLRLSQRMDETV